MEIQERTELLARFEVMQVTAFAEEVPVMELVQKIIAELNSIPTAEKHHFKDFAEKLKNLLFTNSISTNQLDLNQFGSLEEIQVAAEKKMVETIIAESTKAAIILGFRPLFMQMLNSLKTELNTLKGYFFFYLQNNVTVDFQPLILHDDKCFYHSVKKKLETDFDNCLCFSIEEFKKKLGDGSIATGNFAVVLLLSTKVNDKELVDHIKETLRLVIEPCSEYGFIDFKTLESTTNTDFLIHNKLEDFLDEIDYVTSLFLMNAELSNDEEKLLKNLFRHTPSILEYKVLKGGKSGSKVLEVKPKLTFSNEITRRYVAKFGPLDGKDKISSEMKGYSIFIDNYSSPNYHAAHYSKNATIEGMKYSYASKDAVHNSYSYASIVSDNSNKYHEERKEIIDELFASGPFEVWKASKEKGTFTISDLYIKYIKPKKFFDSIQKIKGISDEEIATDALKMNFQKIMEYSIETLKKVCHGDLHSENFFKDDSGIYLIDFGFTGLLHALVDHTALECSIKFKHVPFYVEVGILAEIENQLTGEDSFSPSFSVTTTRKDLLKYFEIINRIRVSSMNLCVNPGNNLEYLISLFVMTCRQVQYGDLNQLYALRSAHIIGERIIQLIG
ncbi:hypothetical protein [Mucilaginibacter endophyticus]|uniref:hypothetical protein n=1 Tax=Mucilaginibacter endophyticus TaxID=2675003 RepID=UPI000E0DA4D4|nr:hypothetical protein [Mucilaginibacter endophyticus]